MWKVKKEEVKGRSRIIRRNGTKKCWVKKIVGKERERGGERERIIKQASAFTMRKVLGDKAKECVIWSIQAWKFKQHLWYEASQGYQKITTLVWNSHASDTISNGTLILHNHFQGCRLIYGLEDWNKVCHLIACSANKRWSAIRGWKLTIKGRMTS